jgi:5'-methylthioadenosine phosphorylase
MTAPRATGDRLGVVHGHSLPLGTSLDGLVEGVVFLPRHGVEGFTPAHRLDHAANVRALCDAGCDRVLALASVGALRPEHPVGSLVCPDDFLAPGIAPSFFDDESGHSVPGFDRGWRARVLAAWRGRGQLELRDGGVYAQAPGPRFETPAEVRMLARDAEVVGMTVAAEAILAREAGLAYAAVCTVDNLANGLEAEPLDVGEYHAARDRLAPKLVADLERVLPELAG